jgi:hypothetical protein
MGNGQRFILRFLRIERGICLFLLVWIALTGCVETQRHCCRTKTRLSGVMAIHGTDFAIEVVPVFDVGCQVTFTCITGALTCSAMDDGKMVTQTLTSGTSWTVAQNQ